MRPVDDLLKKVHGVGCYPASLAETLSIIPQCIRRRLLKIAKADEFAGEKIINRPALVTAFALLGRLNDDELTQWLHRTDKEILSLMGFPVTARNIFKRLVPLALTKKRLHQLNSLLLNCPSTFKRMYHIDRINEGVLAILFNPPLDKIVSIELLNEVGINRNEDGQARTMKQLRKALALQERLGKNWIFPLIKSMEEVHRILKEFKESLKKAELPKATFPPPIRGTEEITPLKSVAEIKEMGIALDNCLATNKLMQYVNRIAVKKDLFLYRVELTKKFQAVFSVKRINGNWIIDEFEHDGFPEVGFLGLEMYGLASGWISDNTTPVRKNNDNNI